MGRMFLCLTVALCDCVHGNGQHQLNWAKGRCLSKKSYLPNRTSKPGSRHTISFHVANFALGHYGLRNHEEVSQDHSRLVCN